WIVTKGTVHLSHTFRGRESGGFPEKLSRKEKSGARMPFVTRSTTRNDGGYRKILHPGALAQGWQYGKPFSCTSPTRFPALIPKGDSVSTR
ncbi:MAG: hypothetical protein IKI66_02805, partial [Bacteroidales bacterium]|nr:hypothetical protein [Bacteroidales bacterium]